MFQNLIGRLKKLNLLTPSALVFALLFVLSLIIIIGQFFHQTLQNEMAEQFNKQQLLLAREVAINIESFIDGVYKDIHIISQLPEIHRIHQSPRCRVVAEAINMNIRSTMLVTIRVLDKNGIMIYDSADPGREGLDLSKTAYFRRATVLPRNERLITDLLDIHDHQPETKEFIVATPIYQDLGHSQAPQFNGVVLAVLSLDAITQNYLSPIKSGTRGYAWMMDSDGTLLYHPTQPMMVGRTSSRPTSRASSATNPSTPKRGCSRAKPRRLETTRPRAVRTSLWHSTASPWAGNRGSLRCRPLLRRHRPDAEEPAVLLPADHFDLRDHPCRFRRHDHHQ